ncbi:MAG: SCO family protein [Rhodospirillales bacterium]|nr:SCO family protein [Rhodospirillales bacterium]
MFGKGIAAAASLLVLAAGAGVWWWNSKTAIPAPTSVTAASLTFGGPFSLVDHTGQKVTDRDYHGSFTFVFFGFTTCPDVCPTTLQNVASVLQLLGDDGAKVRPLFVTVDPERDTPATLAGYVTLFDPRIVGLTGTPEQIAQVARAYRIHYRKASDSGAGYLMEHTAVLFLMAPDGRYLAHIPPDMPPRRMAETIRQHMADSRSPSSTTERPQ